MIDECFAREIKKIANGDGSREAKFEFLEKARTAARELSRPDVEEIFGDVMKKYGRVVVGVCVAATILDHPDYLHEKAVWWAQDVMWLWTNRPADIDDVKIRDNLHYSRIEDPDYAGELIKYTSM